MLDPGRVGGQTCRRQPLTDTSFRHRHLVDEVGPALGQRRSRNGAPVIADSFETSGGPAMFMGGPPRMNLVGVPISRSGRPG